MNQKLKKQIIKSIAVLFSAAVIFSVATPQTFYAVVPEGSNQTINQEDLNNRLFQAVEDNNLAECQNLIEQGADVNAMQRGATLLATAIFEGNLEVVNLLIEKGANVNYVNKDDLLSTHLYYAIWFGRLEILELLINKGANVNAKGADGFTPLYNAIRDGHHIATYRASYSGFYGNDPVDIQTKICMHLIHRGADINAKDNKGDTPLHYAAFNVRNKKLMTLLINRFGADITAKDNKGDTPLHWAAEAGNLTIFDSFSRNSTTWVDCVNTPNNNGQTPLHLAAQHDNKEMCLWLLDHEAKRNVQDSLGFTPFDYAYLNRNKDVAAQLLCRPYAVDDCSSTFFFNHTICNDCLDKLSKSSVINCCDTIYNNDINNLCPSCKKQFVDAHVNLLERADKIDEVAPKLLTKFEYNQKELDSFTSFLEHSLCKSCCFKVLNNIPHPCKSCKEKLEKYIQEQLKLKNK